MKRWLGGLMAFGLGVRLVFAWAPIETLIARTLPDDAFIYFVIARNVAAGLGATFDGLRPTNGFHPLWTLFIAPIFGLFPSGDLPIHLVLTLSVVCAVVAGGLTAWVVWRATRNPLAVKLSLGLYLFNPRLIQESVNGLETGLALLCLSICLAAWVGWQEHPDHKGRASLFGLSVGLTFLARSDLAVIGALLFLATAIKIRWQFANLLIAALTASLTVAPWLIWSQVQIGTVVQSSGVAIPSLVAARIQAAGDVQFLWDSLLFPILNFSFRNSLIYPGVAILASLFGLVFVRWPIRSVGANTASRELLKQIASLWLPLAGALLIVVIHTVVRWYPRGWYFAPLAWAWALVGGPLLAAGLMSPAGRRFGRIMMVLLGLIVIGQSIKMLNEPDYRSQTDMRRGADWLAANTTAADTVGAFNAGIYAYYSGRRVLSLDGLVDWGAIEARQQNRLLDYFVERGGTLIVDHRDYIESFRSFLGSRKLIEVKVLPVIDQTYGPLVIYSVSN